MKSRVIIRRKIGVVVMLSAYRVTGLAAKRRTFGSMLSMPDTKTLL